MCVCERVRVYLSVCIYLCACRVFTTISQVINLEHMSSFSFVFFFLFFENPEITCKHLYKIQS